MPDRSGFTLGLILTGWSTSRLLASRPTPNPGESFTRSFARGQGGRRRARHTYVRGRQETETTASPAQSPSQEPFPSIALGVGRCCDVDISPKAMRYSEISRLLAGVSQKMLTQTLRSLERDGLLTRTAPPTVTVTHELTDLGLPLHHMTRGLRNWGQKHMAEVLAAATTTTPHLPRRSAASWPPAAVPVPPSELKQAPPALHPTRCALRHRNPLVTVQLDTPHDALPVLD